MHAACVVACGLPCNLQPHRSAARQHRHATQPHTPHSGPASSLHSPSGDTPEPGHLRPLRAGPPRPTVHVRHEGRVPAVVAARARYLTGGVSGLASRSRQNGPGGGSVRTRWPSSAVQPLPGYEWPAGSHVLRCWLPRRGGGFPAHTAARVSVPRLAPRHARRHGHTRQRAPLMLGRDTALGSGDTQAERSCAAAHSRSRLDRLDTSHGARKRPHACTACVYDFQVRRVADGPFCGGCRVSATRIRASAACTAHEHTREFPGKGVYPAK